MLLVGYGVRGRQWHSALGRSPSVEVLAAVDPDEDARGRAEAAGLAPYPNLDDALGMSLTGLALVCSPPAEHADHAVACLESGWSVMVEKPLALSLKGARAVARAAELTNQAVVVGQNFRFRPGERTLRRLLDLKIVGTPLASSVLSVRPPTTARDHVRADPHGTLWDICLHHLDCLRTRFDDLPARVRATNGPAEEWRVELEWDDGFVAGYRHHERSPVFHHHELLEGTSGAVMRTGERVTVISPAHRPRRARPRRAPTPESTIIEALLDPGHPAREALSARANLPTIAIVEAAIRSAGEGGAPVGLGQVLPGAGRGGAANGAGPRAGG
ncbi:MAG: Gfo/Idh/MocA family protein [Acidimicrobiia bacterium]